MRLVFDIETNGLLDTVSTVHCLVALDADTEQLHSFGPSEIPEGLKLLENASELISHNGIKYDLPVLKKLYPSFSTSAKITDTLVLARLIYSDLKSDREDGRRLLTGEISSSAYGSHSLAAWGQRIGLHKMEHNASWDTWTPEMQMYCEHDTRATASTGQPW